MNELNCLIGTNDIINIIYTIRNNPLSTLVFTFGWEVDCGCFSYTKNSTLTIHFPILLSDCVKKSILNHKGKIWAYILNHKEYNGALLELKRGDFYD